MRSRSRRNRTAIVDAGTLGGALARHPREFVAIAMATAATLAIFVNALFLQHGPHPAPIFATRSLTQREAALPPHRPVVPQVVPVVPKAPAHSQAHVTSDIQRELARRGFYDGAVDGIWGAKTDAAARDFVQAAGLKLNPEPSDSLLRALAAAPVKTAKIPAARPAPAAAPPRKDAIAAVIAPDKRMLAVQRALADFGYGQIRPTGVYDQDTRAAIEKFQRDHNLPVDGRMSDRFVRELAAMTGRPLEY